VSKAPPLLAAAQSAAEELARTARRFEVFARTGESFLLRADDSSVVERRSATEVGVACRVWAGGGAGFAASSGGGARIGREVAVAALDNRVPAPDPLPPREQLGVTAVPEPAEMANPKQAEATLISLLEAIKTRSGDLRVVEARVLCGSSESTLLTGEGFLARARAAGSTVETLIAPPVGPWRLLRWAGRSLADLDVERQTVRIVETSLLATRGGSPERQLADVVAAPAVAAPLVLAMVEWLEQVRAGKGAVAARGRVSPAWYVVDRRAGPDGLLPLPFDGEGLPARSVVLVAGGAVRERLLTWNEASRLDSAPGGSVRPSYRLPPSGGAGNLIVEPRNAQRQAELLRRLANGYYLALPAGPVDVDCENGQFSVRVAAVGIAAGKPVSTHALLDLRGSFKRLLAALEATGTDSECCSLGAAVTTPSLLLRQLEVA
jgi:predicted Zn-dependent protease